MSVDLGYVVSNRRKQTCGGAGGTVGPVFVSGCLRVQTITELNKMQSETADYASDADTWRT